MDKIKVEQLTFSYDGEHNAVENVSFQIEAGSYTTIVGHNGSGKSTIAKLLIGLLEKGNGAIYIDQIELTIDSVYDIRNKVGIVFQNPDNQFIGATVADDIAFGLENHQVPTEKMQDIIERYAEKVNMRKYLNSEPTRLSGGQKQRVAIAGVLAMQPEILIFDESTSMLDPQGKAEINALIQEIHQESNITIISITHDIEEVATADHVIVMDRGHVVMDGKPDDILLHEQKLLDLQLDIPFALKFRNALKKQQVEISACTRTMPITFKQVAHTYNPDSPLSYAALKNVNLDIAEGKVTAIIGETGSGKSTLVQHLNALLLPSEGKIEIIDKIIYAQEKPKNLKDLRKQVGLVFQFPEYQLFEETIEKDISFGPKNFGVSEEEAKQKAKQMLSIVGLDESYLERSPFDLSGGQKRRIAIAGILAMDPQVLVLDEPTAGLDPQGAKDMMQLFVRMNKEFHKTVLIVTHDMEHVLQYCDEVVVMQNGEVAQTCDVRSFFEQIALLEQLHINPPAVIRLREELRRKGFTIDKTILDIDELARVVASEVKMHE